MEVFDLDGEVLAFDLEGVEVGVMDVALVEDLGTGMEVCDG